MESNAPNETIKPQGARFGPEGFVANTLGLPEALKPRAVLALRAMNVALDELDYTGTTLPAIVFSSDLVVNGKPVVAGIATHYGEKDETALLIDLGNKVASKGYADVLIQRFRNQGLTDEQIAKMTLVETMFEEAQHYVDLLEGKIPEGLWPTGIHPDHRGVYYEQEHERRAEEFRKKMIEKHKDLYNSGDLFTPKKF